MSAAKAQNDPWGPLPEDTNGISPPPVDPRYQLIDSARYIDSLEKKLKRIQGKHKPEPSSRQIIDSLASFREDQMHRFMKREQNVDTVSVSITESESVVSGSVSYLQRRLHPERQAINMEELFELLKDDELARNRAESEEEEKEKERESNLNSTVANETDSQKKESDSGVCGNSNQENYLSTQESENSDDRKNSSSGDGKETEASEGER